MIGSVPGMPTTAGVTSSDGTILHVSMIGEGEPVVLVHGTAGSGNVWALVTALLMRRYRVVTYDRRGRGKSGDAPDYSFAGEVEDLNAVLDSIGTGSHLVGHSFGARVALTTALQRADLRTLILYEPPLDLTAVPSDWQGNIDAATAIGDWDVVLTTFFPTAGVSVDELSLFRSLPEVWDRFLDAAPTVQRELHALQSPAAALDGLRPISVPTEFLVGELTDAPVFLGPLDALARRLRASRRFVAGERHIAMAGAPELLAHEISSIIDGSDSEHSSPT